MSVHVYYFETCPFCRNAFSLLQERGVPFNKTLVDPGDSETREKLQEKSGMRTFPQIFHGDTLIGGFSELATLDKEEGLEKLKESNG